MGFWEITPGVCVVDRKGTAEGQVVQSLHRARRSPSPLTALNIPWIFRMPPDATVEQAVTCLLGAAGKAGPNRGRLRDVLASGTTLAGVRFDSRGEER